MPGQLGDFYGPRLEVAFIMPPRHISLDRIQSHGYKFLQWKLGNVIQLCVLDEEEISLVKT